LTTTKPSARILARVREYAALLVHEGRDPDVAQRTAEIAYGLKPIVANQYPFFATDEMFGPDLPRASARALVARLASERPGIEGPKREGTQAARSREWYQRNYVPHPKPRSAWSPRG
jgi:hypothetical protein